MQRAAYTTRSHSHGMEFTGAGATIRSSIAYHPVEPVLGTARRVTARVAKACDGVAAVYFATLDAFLQGITGPCSYRTAAMFFASGVFYVHLQSDTSTAHTVLHARGTATGWQPRGRDA